MMLSLLHVYNKEIKKNKQTDAEDKQDDVDATMNRINSADNDDQDKDIDENIRTTGQSPPLNFWWCQYLHMCKRKALLLRMRH
jgi:hypothetical protein